MDSEIHGWRRVEGGQVPAEAAGGCLAWHVGGFAEEDLTR